MDDKGSVGDGIGQQNNPSKDDKCRAFHDTHMDPMKLKSSKPRAQYYYP